VTDDVNKRRKPGTSPPAPASFETLDEALRALADRFGSRWRWVSIRPRELAGQR
jgi:hypothetical protein